MKLYAVRADWPHSQTRAEGRGPPKRSSKILHVASSASKLRLHPCVRLLPPLGIQRERIREFQHVATNPSKDRGIGAVVQGFRDPAADLARLVLFHAAGGQGGRSDAHAARLHGGIGVERKRILVNCNSRL